MPPRPRPVRRAWAPAVLAAASIALAGCASDPPTVSPSGVDLLEVPTPSPDPDDFVERIDNPWLPLLPGARWTFETGSGEASSLAATGRTRQIAGVTVTELRSSGGATEPSVLWLAQDEAGNVWLFGATEEGESWEAGEDGARAALAMPAAPRRGDGWVGADPPGDAESRVTAVEVDDDRTVLEVTSSRQPGVTVTTTYARGTGPVLVESDGLSATRAEMVAFDPGTAAR